MSLCIALKGMDVVERSLRVVGGPSQVLRIFMHKRKTPKSPLEDGRALRCADDHGLIDGTRSENIAAFKVWCADPT